MRFHIHIPLSLWGEWEPWKHPVKWLAILTLVESALAVALVYAIDAIT